MDLLDLSSAEQMGFSEKLALEALGSESEEPKAKKAAARGMNALDVDVFR